MELIFLLYLSANEANHNKDYSVVKTLGPEPSSFNGGFFKLEMDRLMKNNLLLGAIAGDVIGSVYEFRPVKTTDFRLFSRASTFTDDTVMTMANFDWLLNGGDLAGIMQEYGRRYSDKGYGGGFRKWIWAQDPKPYGSYGNGSAMRVSPVGWAFETLDETLDAAKRSAEVTHDHPEGIKGAQAVAAAVYLVRAGKTKTEIKNYIEQTFDYDLGRSCDGIRPGYKFEVACQRSVPESIVAFLDSTDYECAIRLAISLGGDADTMAAIAGSIAEAYYKVIPAYIKEETLKRLPMEFLCLNKSFCDRFLVLKSF